MGLFGPSKQDFDDAREVLNYMVATRHKDRRNSLDDMNQLEQKLLMELPALQEDAVRLKGKKLNEKALLLTIVDFIGDSKLDLYRPQNESSIPAWAQMDKANVEGYVRMYKLNSNNSHPTNLSEKLKIVDSITNEHFNTVHIMANLEGAGLEQFKVAVAASITASIKVKGKIINNQL